MAETKTPSILGTLVCAAALALSGCASSSASRDVAPTGPDEIFGTLRREHPQGLAPNVAQSRMEEHGFECRHIRNGRFAGRIRHADGRTESRVREDIEFLRCQRKTTLGRGVTSTDDVALVIEDGLVVEVLTRGSATGL